MPQTPRYYSRMLAFLHVLPVPADAVKGWLDLLRRRPVTGGDGFDLQRVWRCLGSSFKLYRLAGAGAGVTTHLSLQITRSSVYLFQTNVSTAKSIRGPYIVPK